MPSDELHVESIGRGSPLVMLHGWAMHSGLWAPLVPRLSERHRLHLVDLPGHGRSDAFSAPLSMIAMVDAVDRAIAGSGVESPCTVLGWSLGGQVALEWARVRPGRIGALVLMSTTPSFVQRPGWPFAMDETTLRRFGDELRIAYGPTLKRFIALQTHGSEAARGASVSLRALLFARGEPSPQTLSDALEVLAATDLRHEVTAISQPALVIAGDRDTMAPVAAAQWLASALPHGTLRVIPGAAHVPFLSHPDAVIAALDAFTSDLETSDPRARAGANRTTLDEAGRSGARESS
jgi:pimeloyl-[acyl-carrier protein] methyl ester esterase